MAASAVVGLLRVLLSANTAEFNSAMRKTSDQARAFSRDMRQVGTQMQSVGSALTTTLTVPIAGLGAAVAKAAIDFEASFAGVRKTVDASEAEFEAMAQAFRQLSKEIPVNVNELNKLGEAAGALGIPKAEVVGFAKVMAQLGVTTNLTSEQAADAIARIQNIFGAAGKDTDRLASTIVALGNAGASTEREITEMAQRIAGAGKTVGLSQADVVAFASTLASVGINAEAGGSAISRVFLKMNDAVAKGGEGLAEWARVAGMSSKEFKRAFETDAAGAANAFITGLGRLKASGENINQTIEGLTGKNIILKDTLFRLSGAGGELARQLDVARKAWVDNNALTEEARKRFETTESQIKLLWNRIKDVGITLGTALLPTIKSVTSAISALLPWLESAAQVFASLPQSVQTTVVLFGAATAAAGPLLYVMGTLARSAGDVAAAFTRKGIATRALAGDMVTLQGASTAATSGLALLGRAAAVTSAALIGWQIGSLINDLLGLETQAARTAKRIEEIAGAKAKAGGASDAGALGAQIKAIQDTLNRPAVGGGGAAGSEVAELTLRLQTLQSQLDVVNKAIKNGAAATISYADAIKYNANIEAVRIGTIDKSAEAQKRSVQALLDLGKITKEQADQMITGLVPATKAAGAAARSQADGTDDSTAAQKKAATAAERYAELLREITQAGQPLTAWEQAQIKTLGALGVSTGDIAKVLSVTEAQIVKFRESMRETAGALAGIKWNTIPVDPKFEDSTWATRSTLIGKNITNAFVDGAQYIDVEAIRKAAAKRIQEALSGGPDFWGQALSSVKDLFANLSTIFTQAFTGGGGVLGAMKAIGVQLADAIATPIIKSLGKVQQAAISIGASAATALGGATGGGIGASVAGITSGLGGAAVAASSWGKAMAGAGMAGSVALSAATMGIGAAAIGVTMLIKKFTDTGGRDAIKKWVEGNFGSFSGLQQKLQELVAQEKLTAAAADEMWRSITQGVGRGNEKQAAAAIAKAEAMLGNLKKTAAELAAEAGYQTQEDLQAVADKAKQVYDYMVASGKYSAEQIADAFKKMSEAQIAAMDDTARASYDAAIAARDNAKKVLDELDSQIKSLQQSIDQEAAEEVMGAQETLDRARLESLKKQREEAQKNLDDANKAIKDAVDAAVAAAQEAAKKAGKATVTAIQEALDQAQFRVRVKVDASSSDAETYSRGGLVPQYRAAGGAMLTALGFKPRGTDTVPAMLTPGELVLNEAQQGRLASSIQIAQAAAVAGMAAVTNLAASMRSDRGSATDARLGSNGNGAGGRELTAKVPVALYLDQFSRDALVEVMAKVVLVG